VGAFDVARGERRSSRWPAGINEDSAVIPATCFLQPVFIQHLSSNIDIPIPPEMQRVASPSRFSCAFKA